MNPLIQKTNIPWSANNYFLCYKRSRYGNMTSAHWPSGYLRHQRTTVRYPPLGTIFQNYFSINTTEIHMRRIRSRKFEKRCCSLDSIKYFAILFVPECTRIFFHPRNAIVSFIELLMVKGLTVKRKFHFAFRSEVSFVRLSKGRTFEGRTSCCSKFPHGHFYKMFTSSFCSIKLAINIY